jgi:hypothetical protein
MKLTRIHIVVLSMSVLLLVSGASVRQPHPMLPSSLTALGGAARAHLEEAFGKLPLYFVENQGQIDGEVAYYVQGSDKTIYFSPQGVTFALTAPVTDTVASRLSLRPDGLSPATLRSESDPPALQRWAVKLDFVGANPDVRPVGLDQTEAVISYFRGPREEWQVGLPTYSRIAYHDLWPGIDLVYYGTVDRLKYEFIVHPGADPAQIRLAYRGADIASDEIGQLEVMTPIGGFADDAPTAYQEVDGQQVAVDIAYDLYDAGGRGNDLGAGAEDRSYSALDIGPGSDRLLWLHRRTVH